MFHKQVSSLLATFLFLATGCGINVETITQSTPTLQIITATLLPSPTSRPSDTPAPPTPAPTIQPVEGTTTTQVNLRGEPSTASPALAVLAPFLKVQILGRDPGGNWYQILHESGPEGRGWVTAAYVQVQDQAEIPVLGGPAGTDGVTGIAIQQINVRSGPGTDFNSLGTVNAQDVVTLTGKNQTGTWLQIEFTAGPDGRGWVNAGFVQVTGIENLPIITEAGQVVGTGTATGVPPTITPTVAAAAQDSDSAADPAVDVAFSPSGARSLFYTGDVSSPDGDAEDWVRFTPYTGTVTLDLECSGRGDLRMTLVQDEQALPVPGTLECGSGKRLVPVQPGRPYLVHVRIEASEAALQSVRYTLSISSVR